MLCHWMEIGAGAREKEESENGKETAPDHHGAVRGIMVGVSMMSRGNARHD